MKAKTLLNGERKMESIKKDLRYFEDLVYPYTVEELEEDGRKYISMSIPDLPGCGAEGETIEEARKNLEDAKMAWIETALDDGLSIPEPFIDTDFSGKFLLRIPPKLHMKLTKIAEKVGLSLNHLIRATLEKTVENQIILAKLHSIETSLNELRIEVFNQRAQAEDQTHLFSLRNNWAKAQSKWDIN
ncbi:MAG: type II toxin-antitoxin system HicB family antitoxin [Desulfobaccales bacterium]